MTACTGLSLDALPNALSAVVRQCPRSKTVVGQDPTLVGRRRRRNKRQEHPRQPTFPIAPQNPAFGDSGR